ncbi:MAG: hypothetical protein P1U47_03540 [Zhongshania sp.]|uniref:hypothetical protein n=1 Tax=Zhongshania sp. TaxID=1971902 RepID=UPI002634D7BB|nr:hypothetical protein [Zhongshania sp.]MDF1691420.1 hypothetical protein [Zhongshania sp.]
MNEENHRYWDTIIKNFGLGLSVLALIFGVYQYKFSIEKDYKKPFWESQLKYCLKVSNAASNIANESSNKKISQESIDKLFVLYFGEAQLFLDNRTMQYLGEIGSHAVKCNAGAENKDICNRPVYNGKSMSVAISCRDMLTESWSISLEDLNSNVLNPELTE